MVKTVAEEWPTNKSDKQQRPFIVELVGPAGAGKTTLSRIMSQRYEWVLIAEDLKLRKIAHIPIFVRNASLLSPIFLRRFQRSRWFTWDEIKAMVYLSAWPRVLKKHSLNDVTTIILDHGPIFKLATLNAFGPERLKSEGFKMWWNNMYKLWASTLDRVIWLDASDRHLIERINSRGQKHSVKGKTEQEASNFLMRYRISYEQILKKLGANGLPKPLQFDTSRASMEQIAEDVLLDRELTSGINQGMTVRLKHYS